MGIPGANAIMVCIWWSLVHLGAPHIMIYQFDDIETCYEHAANLDAPFGAVDFKAMCLPGPSTST
jgi:hypothetical protein